MMLRLAFAPLLLAAMPVQKEMPPPDALEIVKRTKTTTATYSLYLWTEVTEDGEAPREEWSAEFHSGDLHRVETPRDRVVANCKKGTGFAFSAETGRSYEGAWIARTACGIDTNTKFEAVEWQRIVQTPFGPADRVRIVAGDLVRRYDISPEGILLGTVFGDNDPSEARRLVNRAVGVERKLPKQDIFSKRSLQRSVVPARYKRAPRAAD